MPLSRAAAALATDGRVYVGVDGLECSERAKRLLGALAAELRGDLFVGVARPGLTPSRLLAALDDAAAETVARQRRRGRERRS